MKIIYVLLLVTIIILSGILIFIGKDVFIKESMYRQPSYLSINDVDVKPLYVTDSYIDVNITAYLNHNGGNTDNAYLLIRAIDSNSKLLVNQTTVQIPDTDATKTIIISKNINIDRNKDYELRMSIFDNETVVDTGSLSIKGLAILTPKSKESGIVLKNIDFAVSGVSAGRVYIKPDIYLENTGSKKSDNLSLIVKAIQADSNLLADKTSVDTGEIKSEDTIIRNVQLNVPDEYNYLVVVELWKENILINSWERPVMLAPTKTMPKGTTEKQVNIEVSNFVRQGTQGTQALPIATAAPSMTPKESGFEILVGISAICLVLILKKFKLRRN